MNRFPADDEGDFSDLRTAVDEIQALLRTRAPLTEASRGWILRQMDTPDIPPSGDVHIYASGGRLRALSTLDDVPLINRQGAAVSNPAYTLTNATPTYTQAQVQTIVDTLDALHASYLALLGVLRAADIINT